MQGNEGDDGVGISSITTYYLISSASSGVTTSTSGWSTATTKPTSSQPYLWSYTHTVYTNGGVYDTSPVVVGNYAKDGQSITGKVGMTIRTSLWKAGVEYRNDSSSSTEPRYLDVVYVKDSSATGGYAVYQCKTTHTPASDTSFSSDSSNWTRLSDVGPIYSPLIVAENSAIEFSQGQQINIMDSSTLLGSFRKPRNADGDASKWGLWLGGSTASSAPFRVDTSGNLYTTNANISGTVNATAGQIGDFTITSTALTTTISGALTTTSGGLFQKGSFWVRVDPYEEVCMGKAARNDLTDSGNSQQACDMYGSRKDDNAINNEMIVRKYTTSAIRGTTITNPRSNPAYAALLVDTDEGIGIRSIGGNLFGSIAQSVIRTSYLTSSEYTAINNNRVGVVVMTNNAEQSVTLPTSPMVGQMFTVIRQGAGNVRVNSGSKIITDVGNGSGVTSVLVETYNNWARFLWDGFAWCYERSYYA